MLTAFGRISVRHPRRVIIIWAIAAVAMAATALGGVGSGGLFERTQTGVPTITGADSTVVHRLQQANRTPEQDRQLLLLVAGGDASGQMHDAVDALAAELWQRDGVTDVAVVPGQGGASLLIVVDYGPLSNPLQTHRDLVTFAQHSYAGEGELLAYSSPLLNAEFSDSMERDLVTGETVALPVALAVMVLVFGGFLAAGIPLVGALGSIAGGLAVLFAFSYPIELDSSAINVVTVLGIGLSIDYGLLIVSRYREEATRIGAKTRSECNQAILQAVATAGRTVLFSAVTVAIAVAGMLVFSSSLIRGFGGAALGVVVMALAASLSLVPAVLSLVGPRLMRPTLVNRVPLLRRVVSATAAVDTQHGFFERLARVVQRRPWTVVVATAGVLVVLAAPLSDIAVRNSQVEMLPADNASRRFFETFWVDYPQLADAHIVVAAHESVESLNTWLAQAATLDGVAYVKPAVAASDGYAIAGLDTTFADQASREATDLVHQLRDLDSPVRVYVGGQAAIQVDFMTSLAEGAVWAGGLVVVATFVLLFFMTGSILVPIKTLLVNGLSLAASIGVMTWIFADGHLEGLLGFTATGGIETYVLVLILAFGFGLSMDYEVFLLARIKEHVDAGKPNDEAVRLGLQGSARIITSAAAVIIIVFVGFATGQLLVIKEVGIGLAVAVALDATVVRMLLVPATMTLLGEWNWWAPAPLRRLHQRLHLSH